MELSALFSFPIEVGTHSFVVLIALIQLTHMLISVLLVNFLSHPISHSLVPDKSVRTALSTLAPPYILSFLHAALVSFRGAQHFFGLLYAPTLLKLLRPSSSALSSFSPSQLAYLPEVERVLTSNSILAAYLIIDLLHVIRLYPRVGGVDIIFHHFAFLGCALVGGWYRMYPFMFTWLITGELSTLFLNMRWFLIKTGRGSTPAFRVVEKLFAVVFVFTRFFVYAIGLVYHIFTVELLFHYCPAWAILTSSSCVVAGFVINLSWLGRMYKIVARGGKQPPPSSPSPSAASAQITNVTAKRE